MQLFFIASSEYCRKPIVFNDYEEPCYKPVLLPLCTLSVTITDIIITSYSLFF